MKAPKIPGWLTSTRRRRRDERGAYAVLFSMMLVLVMALAALAVDIASQVASKQTLRDTLDAAAHAGAYSLPGSQMNAENIVRDMALANDPGTSVTTDLWCVIASTGAARTPEYTQIPNTCKPHGSRPYPGTVCDEYVCFIPCRPSLSDPTIQCNTVRVADEKTVPYAFAPAIGYDEGSTGGVVSIACKGTCGSESPNPLDIVIMADRTPSMSDTNRDTMKNAIADSLTVMNPELHYVALGTLHKSEPRKAKRYDARECPTHESGVKQSTSWGGDVVWDGHYPRLESTNKPHDGDWVAVPFSNTYLTGPQGTLVESDDLVHGIRCMPGAAKGNYGTHLASALKGATRYVLGMDSNNLGTLPVRDTPAPAQKVIVFETDGSPDEVLMNGYKALSWSADFGAGRNSSNGDKGCQNFVDMAAEAKAKDVLIITIGFGKAGTARCIDGNDSTRYVRDVLAEAASPVDGTPSTASNCNDSSLRASENKDGDYFFCAASGSELEQIFRSAFGSLTKGIKFLKMPG